jgi:uncharacterized protein with NRDE domain
MCLIAFAIDSHPCYRLVLVANRDEYRNRATEPAGFWKNAPHVLAGRDRLAGGTWMGITTCGKVAAVTNYRDARQQVMDPPSRGLLVADYLRNDGMAPANLRAYLTTHGSHYDGFNLIYGTVDELHYFTNRGGSSGPVSSGVHALSNHLLDTHWPKVISAKEKLARTLERPELTAEELLTLLADSRPFSDELLPDTGIGPERERFLSPLFINGETYCTRSTTVILVDFNGMVIFLEQGYDTPKPTLQRFTYNLHPAK